MGFEKFIKIIWLFFILQNFALGEKQNEGVLQDIPNCNRLYTYIFNGYYPIGKSSAGNFTEHPHLKTVEDCVADCCLQEDACNVALIFNHLCYHVRCISDELCIPKQKNISNLQMVLVSPRSLTQTWPQILSDYLVEEEEKNYPPKPFDFIKYHDELQNFDVTDLSQDVKACEMGLDSSMCDRLEECVQLRPKSRQGVCACLVGFSRNRNGDCIRDIGLEDARFMESLFKNQHVSDLYHEVYDRLPPKTDDSSSVKKVVVSVASKKVRLPEKEATLVAFTIPDEKAAGDKYRYTWTLISQPNESGNNGTISDQTKDKIMLTNLSEGQYRFRVQVMGNHSFGETEANITVLPFKQINKPPVVIITPKTQVLKLPNSNAILDGSGSHDDSTIVSYHWDLVEGPIGYEPNLTQTSTLQLTDLKLPGNYTFKLTLTDEDGTQNSSKASIKVLKGIDYPPEANTDPNVMVRLPQKFVILNGSSSTDDRGIVSWEWTKDIDDSGKAVDMQDTRTPYLKLSNLQVGTYKFHLKVTDISDQSSNTSVLVFVKPAINLRPVASAGRDVAIFYPQQWATLKGYESNDDKGIVVFLWKQVEGPSRAKIECDSCPNTNVTGLDVGFYTFRLRVEDEENESSFDTVDVTVNKDVNKPPVANAGCNRVINLPQSRLVLDGSLSTDDEGIVNYEWERLGESLMAGDVLTEKNEPVLMVANLIPGKYAFKLTVEDQHGAKSDTTVKVTINPDPNIHNLIEMTLATNYNHLTSDITTFILKKIQFMLDTTRVLNFKAIKKADKSSDTILRFNVLNETNYMIINGVEIIRILRDKLNQGYDIMGIDVLDMRTVICQNKCSDHGTCIESTRRCNCETFWMTNIFAEWMTGEGNCDWSVLYVAIGVSVSIILFTALVFGISFILRRPRLRKQKSNRTKYALVGSKEEQLKNGRRNNTIISETDGTDDSDVLFDNMSQKKKLTNGGLFDHKLVHKTDKNFSQTRLGRKIKI